MSSVKICMTVLLVINTWTDIRKKEICLPVLFIFLAGGILWRIRQGLLWPAGIISMGIGVFIILNRFDQWRNGRIWRRIADTDNGLCAGSRRTGRDPLWCIIVVRNLTQVLSILC